MGTSVLPSAVCAHIDWITATARPDDTPDELLRIGKAVALDERKAGNRLRRAHWRDYQGWQCGRVFLGERQDSALVRVESDLADTWASALAAYASNVSRLDLACTWRQANPPPREWIDATYRERRDNARGRRQQSDGLLLSGEAGATLTVGARTSELYGRCYAKGAQEPTRYPADTLRAELEIKPRDSTPIRLNLAKGLFTGERIAQEVGTWFQGRGIHLPMEKSEGQGLIDLPPHETDTERTLLWLSTQVAPAVARCIAVVGLRRVLVALALPLDLIPHAGQERPGPGGPNTSRPGNT